MHNKNIYGIIDSLKVSDGWKNVFKKIQVAYYHNFYQGKSNNVHTWRYGQNVMGLKPEDRFKFFTAFNFFALINPHPQNKTLWERKVTDMQSANFFHRNNKIIVKSMHAYFISGSVYRTL